MPLEWHRHLSDASSAHVGIHEELPHSWSCAAASNILEGAVERIKLALVVGVFAPSKAPVLPEHAKLKGREHGRVAGNERRSRRRRGAIA